jgi:hypothetical protein
MLPVPADLRDIVLRVSTLMVVVNVLLLLVGLAGCWRSWNTRFAVKRFEFGCVVVMAVIKIGYLSFNPFLVHGNSSPSLFAFAPLPFSCCTFACLRARIRRDVFIRR